MSRFREPPDPVFHALNASIGFDRRLAPYDVRQSKAHVSMLAEAGILERAEADELLRGLDAVARRARGRHLCLRPGGRGHPHGDRAPADRDRRAGRRQAPHRAVAQRPGGDRHGAVRARAGRGRAAAPVRADGHAHGPRRAPCRLADAGLHPPPAGAAGLSGPSPAGVLLDVPPRPRAVRGTPSARPRSCRSARARWPGSTGTPGAIPWRASWASTAWSRTPSTRSPTATSCSTT